jgi:hypothetical protein
VKAGGGFTAKKLKGFGRCLDGLFDCAQLEPGDPGCLAAARQSCDKAFATIESEALKLEPVFTRGCGGVAIADLAPETGLDLDGLTEECDVFGVSGLASVLHYKNCVHRQHECVGDDLLRFTVPRADELLALVGRVLPGSFFCPREDDEEEL